MSEAPGRATDSPMWIATRALHHACERHPVGAAMSNGSIPSAWWNAWLCVMLSLHRELDPHLPAVLSRSEELEADIIEMRQRGNQWFTSWHANLLAAKLKQGREIDIQGAAYVLTGAHLMGGAVTAKAISDRLPVAHLRWTDRKAAMEAWAPYRWCEGATGPATGVFRSLLYSMGEIMTSFHQHRAEGNG